MSETVNAKRSACGCGGGCHADAPSAAPAPEDGARLVLLRRGLRLEYLTVGWNVVEGLVSVAAAVMAGSVALMGFGIDSFVETASGLILIWRLRAEHGLRDREAIETLDRRAHKLVGLSLFALAAYVAFDATSSLIRGQRPEHSLAGMIITGLSLGAMLWLARAKRRVALALESRALEADSFQTTACWWLSLITLCGLALNAAFGWWWADPVAALGMTVFIAKEGREAWRGEECGCRGG
ncbi:MAG: cation transporter [Deltaproteobacteria bacterium]|nr:cation transporter [Deltaproteobacteria bacterium]